MQIDSELGLSKRKRKRRRRIAAYEAARQRGAAEQRLIYERTNNPLYAQPFTPTGAQTGAPSPSPMYPATTPVLPPTSAAVYDLQIPAAPAEAGDYYPESNIPGLPAYAGPGVVPTGAPGAGTSTANWILPLGALALLMMSGG